MHNQLLKQTNQRIRYEVEDDDIEDWDETFLGHIDWDSKEK